MIRSTLLLAFFVALSANANAQYGESTNDSGGPLSADQAQFDVTFYELNLTIDPAEKFISGAVTMKADILEATTEIVLDLDDAFEVTEVYDGHANPGFVHEDGEIRIFLINLHEPGDEVELTVFYEGNPVEAARPPWDGGFSWEETASGEPWVAVSCQGEGADLWWPVKDHPSDEPDAMRINLTVPAHLRGIANGQFEGVQDNYDGTKTEQWFVSTPINNYGVSFGVGPYEEVTHHFESTYGYEMPVTFYVLPERKEDAERQMPGFLDALDFLERTFGPYGFREDGYKILHVPYLGMEHQSLIAYGSTFEDNEFGFDWLHFHELAHEWWANLATAPDWSDFWIHESFANYAEALYAEDIARRNGEDADAAYLTYMQTVRDRISNVLSVAPMEPRTTKQMYNLPDGSFNGDIYFKGSWFLHTLRFLIDDDQAFFRAMRRIMYPDPAMESRTDGAANHFVTTYDVQRVFEEESGMNLDTYFKVYLFQPHLPRLEVDAGGGRMSFEWVLPDGVLDENETFDLPVEVQWGRGPDRIIMSGGIGWMPLPASMVHIDPHSRILMESSRD